MKKTKVIIEKTKTGYSAYAAELPVFTTGSTIKELTSNMIEALQLHDEDRRFSPRDLDIRFSIPSLFELYPINVKHFAIRIGMNYTLLSQYVQGRKSPSEKQVERIVQGLREVGKELSCVNLS